VRGITRATRLSMSSTKVLLFPGINTGRIDAKVGKTALFALFQSTPGINTGRISLEFSVKKLLESFQSTPPSSTPNDASC
jgi:hypothetical protein